MPGGNPHHQGNPTRPPISKVSKDFLAGAGKRKGNKGGQPVRYVKVALRKDNHTIITRLKCLRRTRLAHLVSLYLPCVGREGGGELRKINCFAYH
jgi:hypothetical protein